MAHGSDWHIGVISDTHGYLRPEALRALESVDHILHAGDVGGEQVLVELAQIAPVTAVRGNMDRDSWGRQLPQTEVVTFGSSHFYLLHDLNELDLDPWAAGCRAVITGHTHKPLKQVRDGVLFLNPGSAGPYRFGPVTLALLELDDTNLTVEIIELAGSG